MIPVGVALAYLVLAVLFAFAAGWCVGRRGGRIVIRVVGATQQQDDAALTDAERAAFDRIRQHFEGEAA